MRLFEVQAVIGTVKTIRIYRPIWNITSWNLHLESVQVKSDNAILEFYVDTYQSK